MSRPFRRWVEAWLVVLCPWVMVFEGKAEDLIACPCGCGLNYRQEGELFGVPIIAHGGNNDQGT